MSFPPPDRDLEFIIQSQSTDLLTFLEDNTQEDWQKEWGFLLIKDIPVWKDLSLEEKRSAIKYVQENKNDEDFGHSGCCTAVHQATAYFLTECYAERIKDAEFFDDLDFMSIDLLNNHPNGEYVKQIMGISTDF